MGSKGLSTQIEPLNILVIDDEVDLRNLFARLLNGEQHQVVPDERAAAINAASGGTTLSS